jgi:hypothetical protein
VRFESKRKAWRFPFASRCARGWQSFRASKNAYPPVPRIKSVIPRAEKPRITIYSRCMIGSTTKFRIAERIALDISVVNDRLKFGFLDEWTSRQADPVLIVDSDAAFIR